MSNAKQKVSIPPLVYHHLIYEQNYLRMPFALIFFHILQYLHLTDLFFLTYEIQKIRLKVYYILLQCLHLASLSFQLFWSWEHPGHQQHHFLLFLIFHLSQTGALTSFCHSVKKQESSDRRVTNYPLKEVRTRLPNQQSTVYHFPEKLPGRNPDWLLICQATASPIAFFLIPSLAFSKLGLQPLSNPISRFKGN